MLALHGVRNLEFHVVQCPRRQNVKTWRILERALLLTFREVYGEVPRCNTQGKRMSWHDEHKYFTGGRLRSIVKKYS